MTSNVVRPRGDDVLGLESGILWIVANLKAVLVAPLIGAGLVVAGSFLLQTYYATSTSFSVESRRGLALQRSRLSREGS